MLTQQLETEILAMEFQCKEKKDDLIDTFVQLDKKFNVREDFKYEKLVCANGYGKIPIQRWFHFKEAFSINLLENLLQDWNIPFNSIKRILDPFCGVGTTLLSTERLALKHKKRDIEVIGFERNPFIHFVANTKLNWNKYNAERFKKIYEGLLKKKVTNKKVKKPLLSTFHRADIFKADVLNEALAIRELIYQVKDKEKGPLLLGFASVLEDISGVRKDGRALRIVKDKEQVNLKSALREKWSNIYTDLLTKSCINLKHSIYLGNGRQLQPDKGKVKLNNVDVIVYSPPYLNNFDYTEVYKIELWMCEFIQTQEQFRELRQKTLRSHPSIKFGGSIKMLKDSRLTKTLRLVKNISDILPNDDRKNRRMQLFLEYFDDLYQSLISQYRVLKKGGICFCIVGNSLHGGIPVPSDLIISSLAEAIGFEVESIHVARYIKHRAIGGKKDRFIRESIIALQKPLN